MTDYDDYDTDNYAERRFTRYPPEIRRDYEHGPQVIFGYGPVFSKLSRKLGGFVEQVYSTAFHDSKVAGWPDVTAVFEAQPRELLGTTYSRTLELETDRLGLAYRVEPPESMGRVTEYVRRGDIRHSQWTFHVPDDGDEWSISEFDYPLRTLHKVELVHIGPVIDPAYPDVASAARAVSGAVKSLARFADADPAEVRKRLSEGRAREFFKRTDGK